MSGTERKGKACLDYRNEQNMVEVSCLKCDKIFFSTSKYIRLCRNCKEKNARIMGNTRSLRMG